MNEALYGKVIADKMDAVTAAIEAINVKYKDYFAGIKSKFAKKGEDTPAKLQDYTLIQWNNAGASIVIEPDVPKYIADETREKFSEIVRG